MKFVRIGEANLDLLSRFLSNLGEAAKSFRYYQKRHLSVIQNHVVTLVTLEGDVPVAYGHLDEEGGEVWLGICVTPAQKKSAVYMATFSVLMLERDVAGISRNYLHP